jgi:hypothetical protein
MRYVLKKLPAFALALILTLIASAEASAQATIVILNGDAAGVGFNDTTPATPVGGNNGTTIGDQRLIAFQAAANIWGATLVSGPTITIRGTWEALTCTATSGTLGSAGNNGSLYRNFTGAQPNFWYGVALANALSGTDRNGATHEINARFNLNLGTPGCLENAFWYYGLDNNHGANGIDLVSVLLHEFAHGLGFQTFTNRNSGAQIGDPTNGFYPSIYDRYLFDNGIGKTWPQMTDAERVASAINTGNLAWIGPQVVADVPGVLSGTPRLRINSPTAIAGNYQVGTASFGPALSPSGITADVVQAIPNDGCTAITNSSAKIALIDRGPASSPCSFVTKVKNAQNAGAVGVIIADNVSNPTPPGMGGTDNTITIPAVSITQANGDAIKAQLSGTVNGTLLADTTTLAGTDSSGRPFMFAPNPLVGGSSVSHWDNSLLPNQLMEPNIAGDLLHTVMPPRDLTFSLMKDIGWNGGATVIPAILLEQGTTNTAAALDSVTRVKGPFTVLTQHNFSSDGRRRIIFFTTNLGLGPGDTTGLSVQASGIPLTVESAGPFIGLGATSYVIVRLPDLLPNTFALTVTLNNRSSTNAPTIQIVP